MHTIRSWRASSGLYEVLYHLVLTFGRGLSQAAAAAFGWLLTWQERASQRHALDLLNDRMLKDIGLTRADVEWETRKPFWRA